MSKAKIPKHLGADGSAFYRETAHEYGIDDSAGRALLTVAAEALDRIGEARKAIAKDGAIFSFHGKPTLNPATKIEKEATDRFLAAMRQLRLDVEPPRPVGRPPGSFNAGR
jgi:phage terminase small subunit